jgi:acyl-CoA synthetase (AMP-forming)/AMP-acid ligase II
MKFESFQAAIDHVAASEEKYALEQREIRGVTYTTFKNGPKTLRDILEYCLVHGDADFLVFEGERYSFDEFYRSTLRIAAALSNDYGIEPGDRVALLMSNVPEYPMLFMAAACIGAVAVPINSWWATEELEYGFVDCAATLVFVDEQRDKKIAPFVDRLGIRRVIVRDCAGDIQPEFRNLLEHATEKSAPQIAIDPDDDFAVLYTSGSAGHPKGVVLTHCGAVSSIQSWLFGLQVADLMGYAPGPTVDADGEPYQPCSMINTPFFHVSATHAGLLLGLWCGIKIVIMKKWDPQHAVELVEQEKVSRFGGVPTMTAELIEAAAAMGCTMDSLRAIDSGGSKRPPAQVQDLVAAVPHALPGTGFGMTETNGLGIGIRGQDYIDQPTIAGRLQPPLQEMRIVDDDDRDLPVDEVGELLLKSPANMRCYFNNPQETAATLQNGWLHTGDLVRVDADGFITLVDRKKDIILRGGENISCSDIPDERLGETVGACVQLRPDATVTESELREFVGTHIAAHKVPSKIWFRDTPLARGATEKIDRRAIRAECVT